MGARPRVFGDVGQFMCLFSVANDVCNEGTCADGACGSKAVNEDGDCSSQCPTMGDDGVCTNGNCGAHPPCERLMPSQSMGQAPKTVPPPAALVEASTAGTSPLKRSHACPCFALHRGPGASEHPSFIMGAWAQLSHACLLYTSPSPRD